MAIDKDKILKEIRNKTTNHFLPLIKTIIAEQLGTNVSDLEENDWKPMLDDMVNSNVALNKILVDEIVSEIKENAEFEIPSANVGLDNTKVKVTIPIGVVSQGAGAAVITNPTPITISGNVISKKVSGKVKKGYIK